MVQLCLVIVFYLFLLFYLKKSFNVYNKKWIEQKIKKYNLSDDLFFLKNERRFLIKTKNFYSTEDFEELLLVLDAKIDFLRKTNDPCYPW